VVVMMMMLLRMLALLSNGVVVVQRVAVSINLNQSVCRSLRHKAAQERIKHSKKTTNTF